MSRFARTWLEAMKELRPKEYRRLQRTGQLQAEARKFEQRARLAFQSARAQLERRNPAPADYLARVQHLQNLASMARELVLHDMLPEPEAPGGPEQE